MHEVKMAFLNSLDTAITFFLEPFGVFYPMEPGETFMVTLQGPIQGNVEVKYDLHGITIYAWSGSTDAILSCNGEELFKY